MGGEVTGEKVAIGPELAGNRMRTSAASACTSIDAFHGSIWQRGNAGKGGRNGGGEKKRYRGFQEPTATWATATQQLRAETQAVESVTYRKSRRKVENSAAERRANHKAHSGVFCAYVNFGERSQVGQRTKR